MPVYTQPLLDHITTAALDWWLNKGTAFAQAIQEKPLLAMMESKKKTFPGGKGDIVLSVKGDFGNTAAPGTGDKVIGYELLDSVTYYTPANLKQARFSWKEHHIGITLTHSELKTDGISVVDTNGESTSEHSGRDDTVLVGLLNDALEDVSEQYARGMNNLLWTNGAADAKALAGMAALVTDDPSIGTVGGIDRTTATGKTWWRNRAYTSAFGAKVTGTPSLGAWGGGPITSSATGGGAVITLLQNEYRQLTRFGGRPNTGFCGSAWLSAVESELRANGNYSMTGFTGGKDVAVGQISYMGTDFTYDPTLDDLGKSKRMYWFDSRDIYLVTMDGEWRHQHSPARPPDKYVMYRGITSTGQLCARRLNSALVMDIA